MSSPRTSIAESGIIRIPLTRGLDAFVDVADRDLGDLVWRAHKDRTRFVATRWNDNNTGHLLLHRVVAKRIGLSIDRAQICAVDDNFLNCTRKNLREKIRSSSRVPVITAEGVYIPLTKGLVAVVSHEDLDLSLFTWTSHKANKTWYAKRGNGSNGAIFLHRVVAEMVGLDLEGKEVDHIDTDGLNCRRSNLRVAEHKENLRNTGIRSNNTSGFKGVTFSKAHGRWLAQIMVGYKNNFLGLFDTAEEAGLAYAEAVNLYHGDFGRIK